MTRMYFLHFTSIILVAMLNWVGAYQQKFTDDLARTGKIVVSDVLHDRMCVQYLRARLSHDLSDPLHDALLKLSADQ